MIRLCVLLFAVAVSLPLILLASPASGEQDAPDTSHSHHEHSHDEVSLATTGGGDQLPDLGMARMTDFRIQKTGGKRLLRFSSVVANTGDGKFEVHGSRPDSSSDTMTASQRIFDADGYRDVPTEAEMYFGGDGHNHWHVRDLEDFELRRLNSSRPLRAGAKHGFCFFDNTRFGSKLAAFYKGCGVSGDLGVTMGLSSGWADIYQYTLPDQYIDITGISDGKYRLTATADASDWFVESIETNNVTWVNLQFRKGQVSVIKQGPAARPVS